MRIAGKILFKNTVSTNLLDETAPGSECGFRQSRRTVNMTFTRKQVDLTKAFETVSESGLGLLNILPSGRKLTPKMVKVIRCDYDGMNVRITNSNKDDDFHIANGIKQGCNLTPTLFRFPLSMMLLSISKHSNLGIQITYRQYECIFNT